MKLVIFLLYKTLYAINVMSVEDILPLPAMISVATTQEFICGVINLQGQMIPMIDLKDRLGLGQSALDLENDVIIVMNHEKSTGFIVDDVKDVVEIESRLIAPPPEVNAYTSSSFITGSARLGKEILFILDIENILAFTNREKMLPIHES